MKVNSWKLLPLIFFLGAGVSADAGEKRRGGPDIQEAQLPADFGIDLQLGLNSRSMYMRGSPELVGTPLNAVGNEVFSDLIQSAPIASLGLPFPWRLTLIDNDVVNAASTAGGQIYVDGAMARLMGGNRGLWAAVLSHEIAHTALRHQVRTYLQGLIIYQQLAYWRSRSANGDSAASWVALGLAVGGPILLSKLGRNQEHEADIQGMMLMARSGYHPDFVFALHHLMQTKTGDQSKIAAFFSGHPRWATRDQRSNRAYLDALAEYNHLWPDSSSSVGGSPPAVAFLEKPQAYENKRGKSADLSVPLYCRNADGPVTLFVSFTHKNLPVSSGSEVYRDSMGNLLVREQIDCPESDDAPAVLISIPSTALAARQRKLKGHITVLGPNGEPIAASQSFDVRFPKP